MMNRPFLCSDCEVPPVDWMNIRPVYKKLQDDFHWLTKAFGISLPTQTHSHLSHLIATIDSIDRNLDNLAIPSERNEFANALVRFLNSDSQWIDSTQVTNEVRQRSGLLKHIILSQNVQQEFCQTASQILQHTEAKRLAIHPRDMIRRMRTEWKLTGHLTILLMGKASTPAFERFFYALCTAMPAVDMIQDVADDYSLGHINVPPTFGLYLRLLNEFVWSLPKLLWLFPRPFVLAKYSTSFLNVSSLSSHA